MHPRTIGILQRMINIAKADGLKKGDTIAHLTTGHLRGVREYHSFFQVIGDTEVVILEDADVLEAMLAMEKL